MKLSNTKSVRRELRQYKRKRGIHHPLLAIDCENDPKTGAFICAGIFGDIKHYTTRRFEGKHYKVTTTKRIEEYITNQDEFLTFLESIKKNSCIMVFFNLSYDKIFFDKIIAHDSVLQSGSRVIMLKLKTGLKGFDLANHTCEGSLEDWINHLEMPEKYGVKKAELNDKFERVMNDAKATYYLGRFLEDFYYYECGIPFQVTIGAAAMKLFTMKYFTDYWARDEDFISSYERQAYFGGRVELFKRGKQKTYSYDVNSMYLSIMRDCLLPDIQTTKFMAKTPKNWKHYLKDFLGIWAIRVKAPDTLHIPVLPVRIDGKLKFPTGEFEGVWCSVEILEALQQGYEIIKVHNFIYYRQAKPYFKDYALFVWKKRQEYKAVGNKEMDIVIKRLGNALYGKFAQRNSDDYFGRLADYPHNLPERVKFFEYAGETWIQVEGKKTPAKFEFPVISAFITAYARVKLYQALVMNADTAIYCDTDSLKLTAPAQGIDIGNELGQWAVEMEGEPVIYRRPKLYGTKKKGVPKRAVGVCLLDRKNEYKKDRLESWIFEKPLREREAIKRGLTPNVWVEVMKHLDYTDDKRFWIKNQSTPINYNDNL